MTAISTLTPTRIRRSGGRARNSTLLDVAAPLIATDAALPAQTRKTTKLNSHSINVRDALLSAREPDELLFTGLPRACDLIPFRPGDRGRRADIAVFGPPG